MGETEYFFRCAYRLPSFDFQSTLSEIDNYVASKLEGAYKGFMMIFTNFGYEDHLSGISLRNLSLLSVLIKLREGLSFLLKEASYKEKNISPSDAEQDIIRLLIYIIDFTYEERRARESGESLDLPEGIVLKLYDILDYAFKAHLGVQLPEREDGDVRADFPSFIYKLSNCWKDLQGKEI